MSVPWNKSLPSH